MTLSTDPSTRRPIRARESGWAAFVARRLLQAGLRPNAVSLASVVFALGAGACLALGPGAGLPVVGHVGLLALAAACIQLRLLCNLFDGMLAIEGRLKSRSGVIFNEVPDRFADLFVLAGAGYGILWTPWGVSLGWAAAGLALITAYIRVFGAAEGAGQHFCGPMAKQHRMAVMTAACLLAAVEAALGGTGQVMTLALAVVAGGCVVTIVRRLRRIARELERL